MTAPTWQELQAAQCVHFDDDVGLAVYASTAGRLVIVIRATDGALHSIRMVPEEVAPVIERLTSVKTRAQTVLNALQERETAMAAHELIQRAKGAS